jgi:heme exporter protein A
VATPDAGSLVLAVENLAAARGLRVLFEGVSLRLHAGEVLELRGPNGSGKSTLLRILAGLTRPMAGEARFSGAAGGEASRHYLGHADAIKPNETAGEQALFWARFFGRGDDAASKALEQMGLANRSQVPGRGLSAGQRRRLALARLLIDPRPVWLLDEPTAALDVEGQARVADLVAAHVAGGGVVVAAMHGAGFAGARAIDVSEMRGVAA